MQILPLHRFFFIIRNRNNKEHLKTCFEEHVFCLLNMYTLFRVHFNKILVYEKKERKLKRLSGILFKSPILKNKQGFIKYWIVSLTIDTNIFKISITWKFIYLNTETEKLYSQSHPINKLWISINRTLEKSSHKFFALSFQTRLNNVIILFKTLDNRGRFIA